MKIFPGILMIANAFVGFIFFDMLFWCFDCPLDFIFVRVLFNTFGMTCLTYWLLFNIFLLLYRKWQQLGSSCVKVKEVVSRSKQLMALPLLPSNLIHSVSCELSPSVLENIVLDGNVPFVC